MRFGEIIKKAWHITWHYRWLWILGVFAGVTGGGSSGGGGGSNFRSFGSGNRTGSFASGMPDLQTIGALLRYWLPFIFVAVVVMFVIGIAFAVLSIGARGGLVWAVNEIEEGRVPRLGAAWNAGFARFWSVLGLGLLLQLPIAIAVFALVMAITVPIVAPLMRGAQPSPSLVIAPVCGSLAIGLPLLLVAGVVLGIMYIIGLRFIILDGMGAVHAAGEGWRAFRSRFGDHAIMYIISFALSVVAGLALVVPIAIFAVPTMVPAGIAAVGRNWGLFAGMVALFSLVVMVLSLLFAAVWGTFTSAMWTVFFRRLTGREVLAPIPAAYAPAPPQEYAPPAPPMYAPPPPPAPPVDATPPSPDAPHE